MIRFAALCAVLAIGGPAYAEIVAPVASTPPRVITPGPKKLGTAYLLSGVGTGVSSALFVTAFFTGGRDGEVNMPVLWAGVGSGMVTPSLGQFYAGRYVTWGQAIRLGGAALLTYAVLAESHDVRCDTLEFHTCRELKTDAYPFVGLAAIAYIGGAAWDITSLPDVIDDYNKTHVAFTPTPIGTNGYGLAAVGTF